MPDTGFFTTTVSSVYPLYLAKVERKNRRRDELDAVIRWLTGYDRFADASDDGDANALAAVLRSATGLGRESLTATLDIPSPLRTKRALGPVEVLQGHRQERPQAGTPDTRRTGTQPVPGQGERGNVMRSRSRAIRYA